MGTEFWLGIGGIALVYVLSLIYAFWRDRD